MSKNEGLSIEDLETSELSDEELKAVAGGTELPHARKDLAHKPAPGVIILTPDEQGRVQ